MGHHLYHIGYEGTYIFRNCWVWVDFYFILTGAFSYRHCQKHIVHDKKYGDEAISYTFRKFRKFVPLTMIAVLIQYCLTYGHLIIQGNMKDFLKTMMNSALFEIMYLSSSASPQTAELAPIWFLSAMFIVLPFSLYMMRAHAEFWKIIAFTAPIIYFGVKGVNTDRAWPNDIVRAFVCMALGTMAVLLADHMKEKYGNKILKIVFSVGEIICLLLAAYISVFNKDGMKVMELLFFIICALLLSQKTWSFSIRSRFIGLLGKISMPMFVLHWVIGSLACIVTNNTIVRTVIYYFLTILLSTCWVRIVTYRRKNA